jgi:hypothetical protein
MYKEEMKGDSQRMVVFIDPKCGAGFFPWLKAVNVKARMSPISGLLEAGKIN